MRHDPSPGGTIGRPRWRAMVLLAATLAVVVPSVMAPAVAAIGPTATGPIPVDRPVRPTLRTTASTPVRVALQHKLDRLRAKRDIPGVSAAILFPDGSLWVGTSGLADVKGQVPVRTDTTFAIASVSKTFTAALILALHDEGRIDLEASVRQYLPKLAIDRRITVHQLLDHTSGLADFFFDPGIDRALLRDRARVWLFDQSFARVGKRAFKPGKGWAYSNTNYLVLGALAERVGGAPLEDQLRERFFGPLGLVRTYDQRGPIPVGPVAHGYRFAPGRTAPIDLSDGTRVVPFTSVISAAGGAGALASTPTDLVFWARSLYGDGGTPAISPAARMAMFADVGSTAGLKPRIPYGLGVQAVDIDGHLAYGHSGRLLGFRSVVRWLPGERVAIAVLTNQSRSDPAAIARSLLRIALRPAPDCVTCHAPL